MNRTKRPRLLINSFLLVSILAISINSPVTLAKGAAIQSNNAASCPRDGTYHANFQGLGTDPSNNQTPFSRPVIFLHGWTGGPMTKTANAISQQFPNQQINPYIFDYSKWSSYWALNPNIAACLADYVNAVSDKYQKQGGDGKVIIVAHSMGGLAIRYAMNGYYVQNPIQIWRVPYIITFDTPYLGSPWGIYALAAVKELLHGARANYLPSPWGQDGGRCLAPHQYTAPLPQGCGDLPPWLPKGIQLTQVAGDINVDRTLFGQVLYTVPLNSDGIVTVPSQHGYLNSGPGVQAPFGDVIVHSTTDSCHIDAGTITNVASVAFPEIPKFAIALLGDYLTLRGLQDLQNNLYRPVVQAYYLVATLKAACSHSNILTDRRAINQTTEVIKSALAQLTPPLTTLNHYLVPDPPFGQGFTTNGDYIQVSGINGLEAVNAMLKNLIVQDQQKDQTTNPDYMIQCRNKTADCWYTSGSAEGQLFISASSSVVSVLIPTSVNYGGVSNESWVSATLSTQTAQPITFADLFSDISQALVAISDAARAELLATNECVTEDLNALNQGLDPTNPDNFKHYAISPSGLTIGFERYQLGIGACGGPSVTIPWSQLQSSLSLYGRQTVSHLR